jgi:hypothetical protein
MPKLMPPKARANSRNKAASPLQKGNTTWTTIYASTVANLNIKPLNARLCQINDQEPNFIR